jgi:archaellum component FlaC
MAIIAALVVLFAGSLYQLWRVRELKQQLADYHETVTSDLSSACDRAEPNRGRARQDLDALLTQVEEAQKTASTAVGRAKTDAQQRAEKLAQDIARRQQALQEKLASEFNEVRQAADQTSESGADVGEFDWRVSETKSALDKTIADLKQVNGDTDVISGLIAGNAQEVAALLELGERNYYEFRLDKSGQPQKVGEISVPLKKTDSFYLNARRSRHGADLGSLEERSLLPVPNASIISCRVSNLFSSEE